VTEKKLKSSEIRKRNKLKLEKPYVYEKILKFEEKLRQGESIAIIQFQFNYSCNFRCIHCSANRFMNKRKARSFTVDDAKNLAEQADELGLARFVMTGGEPLIAKELDEFVEAINPDKFYINCDTNGWLLDNKKARHLKNIGIDRIQLSIDSLNPEEHDSFRNRKGAFEKALRAVDAAVDAGLDIFIQTVATKQRLYSEEFVRFIEYFNKRDIGVFVSFAKPVGVWEGKFDVMIDKKDIIYFERELETKYNVFSHLTPAYGLNMGCHAVKGMISITQYGDVMPCPYIHVSLGNVFEEPLEKIIRRGLDIKFFGEHVNTCLIAEDREFIEKYIVKNVYNKPLPVPYYDVFTLEDKTEIYFNKSKDFFK